ncbi:MAG: HU family DNA-binding protein [Bdellovibrionales bacterium]|nr:HU family DNA-binding protein [Bdellovibrionales bacterium]
MNKEELIDRVAAKTGFSKAETKKLLDCIIENIKKSVKKGDSVKLVGFGTFAKARRKERRGRHPQTGIEIKIPAVWSPKFRPGSDFKVLLGIEDQMTRISNVK